MEEVLLHQRPAFGEGECYMGQVLCLEGGLFQPLMSRANTFSSGLAYILASDTFPRMAVRMLLKSCAIPAASTPMDSSLSALIQLFFDPAPVGHIPVTMTTP